MRRFMLYKIICLVLGMLLLAGCGKSDKPAAKQLALCSSMGKKITELFAASYSKATGTKVTISYHVDLSYFDSERLESRA